jgi:uncharacterized ubiquitin-like protein YukD
MFGHAHILLQFMVFRYDKEIGVLPQSLGSCDMGLVTVNVWDATGNKRQQVQMPDDAPVNRLLVVLLDKLSFPVYAPDGQPLSYKLHHRSSGKQLLDEQSLKDIGVKEGDVLRLQPEITAG